MGETEAVTTEDYALATPSFPATAKVRQQFSFKGYSLGLQAGIPVSENFRLYAKTGIMFWDLEATAEITTTVNQGATLDPSQSITPFQRSTVEFDDNDFYFGFGGEFLLNDAVSIGLEYTLIDVDIKYTDDTGAKAKESWMS